MSARESTLQSLDPLGALAGRPLTILAAVSATVIAVVLTALHGSQVGNLALAIAALGVAAIAAGALVHVTAPARAPVTRAAAILVVLLGFAASVVFAAATWGQNTLVRDDWGSFVLGLLLLALSPYRPPREIVMLAVAASVLVGILTVVETRFFVTGAPPSIYVVVSIVPILALAFAGAAFASAVLVRIERWRQRAEKASLEHAENQEEGIVRSVQQSRVSILNREVVPLFTELLDGGRVTADHVERATRVSTAVRGVMVAETERTWLDDLLAPAVAGEEQAAGQKPVADPLRLAERMDFDQRAAVRALVAALTGRLAVRDLRAELDRTGDRCRVRLTCTTDVDEAAAPVAPYLAVLRVVFEDVSLDTSPSSLTLRFSYVCN